MRDNSMALHIVPFTAAHLDGAAALLAERQRAERLLIHALPQQYEQVDVARSLIEQTLSPADPRLAPAGVAALRDRRLAGYLLGTRLLIAPGTFRSLFYETRSVNIGLAGCAVDPAEGGETLRALYAALAPRWLADGCFAHYVEAPSADPRLVEAWFSLGFGQNQVHGLRDTGPVADARTPAGLEIHQAGAEDLGEIVPLVVALNKYHAQPPMFQVYFSDTDADARLDHERLLADPINSHFLAYRDGRTVGLQVYTAPTPGLHTLDKSIYLRQGYSEAEARGGGVGSAMLGRGMAWAREQGYEHCSVSWLSNNLLGARFWQARGFRPIGYRLLRRVDERIAWAHGRD
jgi:GNAT superfamily N-acetyltransferase